MEILENIFAVPVALYEICRKNRDDKGKKKEEEKKRIKFFKDRLQTLKEAYFKELELRYGPIISIRTKSFTIYKKDLEKYRKRKLNYLLSFNLLVTLLSFLISDFLWKGLK